MEKIYFENIQQARLLHNEVAERVNVYFLPPFFWSSNSESKSNFPSKENDGIYAATTYLYTWILLHTWPVKKSGNFPFQKGKKEILKNFPKYKSIVYNTLQTDSKRLLWYIFLFLTEHNPSFILFLICFYFLPNLSFDVLTKCVLIKKKECEVV